ncbi:MAG: molybdenum ABC transporter ATP-binding protein [Paracoccus sp. (in: a-proteobacteria)]|nr:molybdenum ABC transporter ATP-binding protein [Paracoccus sp. (in: a-proteobacteria)]
MSLSAEIRHAFEGFTLDASFRAGPGVTALFGPSGAGKTTIINAVAGLLRPDFARISTDGQVLADSARGIWLAPARRRIGYVFQEARLFPHLSVRGNLAYARRFLPRADRPPPARQAEVVDLLGIGALLDRRPGALSGGERQRVALGRAILSAPRLLLLDEPLAALDAARKAEILPYLEGLRDLGLPILYVSHSAAEITRLAGHVVMIEEGRVIAAGPAETVMSDPASARALGNETGALLPARVSGAEEDGLSRLDTPAGPVWVARLGLKPGSTLRLRILAHEVMLATERPSAISALNVLAGSVEAIEPQPGGSVLIRVALTGEAALLARITERSRRLLDLAPGRPVHAILKSVAIADLSRG